MSETFSVWHAERESGSRVTCYLTAINVQEIADADDEFLGQLGDALGIGREAITSCDVGQPFLTDHLSSPSGDDWRDVWLTTWPLTLKGSGLEGIPSDPVDVLAWDGSWTGEEASPTAFEVVAAPGLDAREVRDIDQPVRRCGLGHLHVTVPTDSDIDVSAKRAAALEQRCRQAGYRTTWLDAERS